MIYLKNFFRNTLICGALLLLLLLSACALLDEQSGVDTQYSSQRPGTYKKIDEKPHEKTRDCVNMPMLSGDAQFAVFPVDNLSGRKAPLTKLTDELRLQLNQKGIRFVNEQDFETFLKNYRIRYTGGIHSKIAQAIEEEISVEASLLTSLESYQQSDPAKISLTSRLILSGDQPEVIWMDSVGLSGDDSQGILGLGRIKDPDILLATAIGHLSESLVRFLSDNAGNKAVSAEQFTGCKTKAKLSVNFENEQVKKKYRPRTYYRSPILSPDNTYTVAVIPFLNRSERPRAGTILMLAFFNQLIRHEMFKVIEPGLVREQLLKYRMIIGAGLSLASADVLFNSSSLEADLLFSGVVFSYHDTFGEPTVSFSVSIIEKKSREIVWSSRSYNSGNEGVFFFDLGRVHTANELATQMARGTLEILTQ